MFTGHVLHIYDFPSADAVKALAHTHGAVLAATPADVELTLAVTCSLAHIPPEMHVLRQRQIPVVSAAWVTDSVQLGALVPFSFPRSTLFHPCMLAGIVATSSGLEQHVKRNVQAAVEFFGGAYHADLTEDCNLVIAEDLALTRGEESATGSRSGLSPKVLVALERRVRCESVGWLQRCVDRGVLCAFTDWTQRDGAEDASAVVVSASIAQDGATSMPSDDVAHTSPKHAKRQGRVTPVATVNVAAASPAASFPSSINGSVAARKRFRDSLVTSGLNPSVIVSDVCIVSLQPTAAVAGGGVASRTVTRGLARELERQERLKLVTSSGPMTRSKTAVLHDLLLRISPKK